MRLIDLHRLTGTAILTFVIAATSLLSELPASAAPVPDSAASAGQGGGDYDQQLKAALALEKQGRQAEASAIYRALATDYPHRYEACHRLGVLADGEKQHLEAQRWFTRAFRLNQEDPELLADMGRCLLRQEKWALAAAALERAVRLAPGDAESERNLRAAYAHLSATNHLSSESARTRVPDSQSPAPPRVELSAEPELPIASSAAVRPMAADETERTVSSPPIGLDVSSRSQLPRIILPAKPWPPAANPAVAEKPPAMANLLDIHSPIPTATPAAPVRLQIAAPSRAEPSAGSAPSFQPAVTPLRQPALARMETRRSETIVRKTSLQTAAENEIPRSEPAVLRMPSETLEPPRTLMRTLLPEPGDPMLPENVYSADQWPEATADAGATMISDLVDDKKGHSVLTQQK
ncbi:MAG: tetratricopeptide repeat protein [Rhodopirellula sp.]|nr:tetratricopeptide repeat protein [Rhodopirellula sp.]